jgi:chromosome segregation ATPase
LAVIQVLVTFSGVNGSGKSAVLTGIVFGLGGTARTSNRGSSNKAFIRNGQNRATVEIHLYNGGENAYRLVRLSGGTSGFGLL